MDHARTEDLQPARAVADGTARVRAVTPKARDGEVDAGFDEREVIAAEARANRWAEHALREGRQGPAQVPQREALVNRESVDLAEHPFVRCVGLFGAIAAADIDDPHRWLLRAHDSGLVSRRLRAQDQI